MKTITLRLNDNSYDLIKKASKGEKIAISNYIEYVTLKHISKTTFVSYEEMKEILNDKELLNKLEEAKNNIKNREYKLI